MDVFSERLLDKPAGVRTDAPDFNAPKVYSLINHGYGVLSVTEYGTYLHRPRQWVWFDLLLTLVMLVFGLFMVDMGTHRNSGGSDVGILLLIAILIPILCVIRHRPRHKFVERA